MEIYLFSHLRLYDTESNNMNKYTFRIKLQNVYILIYVTSCGAYFAWRYEFEKVK